MSGDPCSLSNPHQVTVSHWHLNAFPNFSTKIISGELTVRCNVISESETNQLVLDTRDLTIHSVQDVSTGQPLPYQLGEVYNDCPAFGAPLSINLPSNMRSKGSAPVISVHYETSPNSSAVQWLEPAQTAGKIHPYLFTQCQAIHCRSLLPCQDSPSVKSTYSAEITVPKELTALMSAVREEKKGDEEKGETRTYKFEQKVPIPSYLTALVVGALEARKIGPRSHVWSEKEFVDKAAYEFAQTEDMLKAAEGIVGTPYLWGVYDLLVLPPSFPYGGMENPCLTFVTPTLLAGDRSLANVVAHEISHSWTGNLVTNRNWEHFWLNEGFTRYLENHIVGAVWGKTEQSLQQMIGWKSLQDSIAKFGFTNPLTALVPRLLNIDPDDAFSSVPYEKGFALLYFIESLVGLDEMKAFLHAYINKFKYKTIDSGEWKDFLLQHFKQQNDSELFKDIDWEAWFYSPGMPPFDAKYDHSGAQVCIELADRWSLSSDGSGFSLAEFDQLSSTQAQEFLNQLLNKEPLSVGVLKEFETIYKMKERTNSEIRFRWMRLALKSGYSGVFPHVVKFLLEQGRMKFVRPLYRELYKCPGGEKLAVDTFTANKHIYHNIAATMIAKDLGVN